MECEGDNSTCSFYVPGSHRYHHVLLPGLSDCGGLRPKEPQEKPRKIQKEWKKYKKGFPHFAHVFRIITGLRRLKNISGNDILDEKT